MYPTCLSLQAENPTSHSTGRLDCTCLNFFVPRSQVCFHAGERIFFWQELSARILACASRLKLNVDEPLAREHRCISPSDFGFHNALAEPNGNIRFLDFEYAGWDDPAKVAGDFFAQLAVPVPSEFFDRFATEIGHNFSSSEKISDRAALLRPAYQIKWCCIALNVFLPVHLARRRFADPGIDEIALKQNQLAKARQLLNSIDATIHGLH